jgi:hypothetical protein
MVRRRREEKRRKILGERKVSGIRESCWGCSFTWWCKLSAPGWRRQADGRQVPCPRILVGPSYSRCLQTSFCSSLHCDFALPREEKGREGWEGKSTF